MSLAYFSPTWFFGYDVTLELSFSIISLLIALFAWRIYKKTDQTQVKKFSIAFLLISISYFVQSIFNFLIISEVVEQSVTISDIYSVMFFDFAGFFFQIFLMTAGLTMLIYMTFKVENQKVFWIIFLTSVLAILLSTNIIFMYNLIASLFLIFLVLYYTNNYLKNRQSRTLLIALAFLLLFLSNIHFILSVNHQLFYVMGHLLELFAYLFILLNFYLVLKK